MTFEKVLAERSNKTIYKDGNRVIKLFEEGYSKADILNEALNLARVEQTGLPVQNLLGVTQFDGKWAIVTEFIPGKTLQTLMDEDPAHLDEYLDTFVEIQLLVQSKTMPLLTKLKDKMNNKIHQTKFDATTRYELHTRLDSMPKHNKLCHGDFTPSNVIMTPEGKPYILDWSHATQGNASADAARTYLRFCLKGQEAIGKKYLKLFCQKSDTALQYIQQWMPIVAASQTVKANPDELDFLTGWVDVVDYE